MSGFQLCNTRKMYLNNGAQIQMDIYAINVGQGDSLILKFTDQKGTRKCYLIDGGRGGKKITDQTVNKLATDRNEQHTKNVLDCLAACGGPQTLQAIIITHPDVDHFERITKLLQWFGEHFNGEILITEAFFKPNHQGIKLSNLLAQIECTHIMYHPCIKDRWSFETIPGLTFHFNGANGVLYRKQLPNEKTVEPPRRPPTRWDLPDDDNLTSIITTCTVNGTSVVLTGDSSYNIIERTVGLRGRRFDIFQVPHHGSKYNISPKICDTATFEQLLQFFYESHCHTIEKNILLQKCKTATFEQLLQFFYASFEADVYLISGGGNAHYDHPHGEVLRAIIEVNANRRRECTIVVTNSYGLRSTKLWGLPARWWEWVTIYHPDDLVHYRDIVAPRANQWILFPQHPLTLAQQLQELQLTMPQFNPQPILVEWSPQGYIKMIRRRADQIRFCETVKPKYPFYYKTYVYIKYAATGIREIDAIIAVPAPHEPWKRHQSLNLHYVLESTLYQHQVKFLEPLPNTTMSRQKEFRQYSYTCNQPTWEQLEVITPVTLQELSTI